jgi:biotin--protein ligase
MRDCVDERPRAEAPFNTARFHSLLAAQPTARMGQALLYSPTLPSTQHLLFDQLANPPDGLLCVADQQTQGKGRGSNVWTSPAGCLCFSFTWSVANAALLPFIQYIVSMALYRAVSQLAGGDAREALGLRLKWPNDVYLARAPSQAPGGSEERVKIGGVLCQSSVVIGAAEKPYRVVAGVGINVLNAEPTKCLRDALEQKGHAAAGYMSRERLAAAFCFHFEQLAHELESRGFDGLVSEYLAQWMHSGQEVQVQVADKSESAKKAVIVGLTRSGFLRATTLSPYTELELHPDGNSLDMLQGLVYVKR